MKKHLHIEATPPSTDLLRIPSRKGDSTFKVAILIAPGFQPFDMIGIQTVFGLMPDTEIYLIWKNQNLIEGYLSWLTYPNCTFETCPTDIDLFAVPMLPPEYIDDDVVISFIKKHGEKARYIVGICIGVVLLGAAGFLKGKRVTASHNAIPLLSALGAKEILPSGSGVIIDGGLYTAGPGTGSFEAALLVAKEEFGQQAAAFAELVIEYDPRPPFGTGNPQKADKHLVDQFEILMAPIMDVYKNLANNAFQKNN